MTEVEMPQRWWRYAVEALGVGRREVKSMHPREREVHDLTVDDYNGAIRKINTSGYGEQPRTTIDLTQTEIKAVYEGLIDIRFRKRDKTPEHWKPATRWAKVELSGKHHGVEATFQDVYEVA